MRTAIVALMIHGITPGPRYLTEPRLVLGMLAFFWCANVIVVILNIR